MKLEGEKWRVVGPFWANSYQDFSITPPCKLFSLEKKMGCRFVSNEYKRYSFLRAAWQLCTHEYAYTQRIFYVFEKLGARKTVGGVFEFGV